MYNFLVLSLSKVDKPFFIITTILTIGGFLIFASAALGLLARGNESFSNIAFSQTVLGLLLGILVLLIVSKLDYRWLKKGAFYLFFLAIVLNILVLFPSIGFEHGGARRWLSLGGLSFQPSEFLKLAFIIYLSAWFSSVKSKVATFKWGFLPLIILFSITALLLLSQPDTDNFLLIILTGVAIFIASGGKWRYVLSLGFVGLLLFTFLALTRPYVMQRVQTFLDPSIDAQGSGYQIQQSLIAIGSGGLFGRGIGQSVQKFNFLPEPVGDSIFAVAAEESGFVGSTLIILLFVAFASRGLKIASRVSDSFGRLVVVGIVIMITTQAFINIGAMLGVIPLSGITLPFVSHGGSSLFFTLLEAGIVLSISKSQKLK